MPTEFIRVKPEVMRPFITKLFEAVDMSADRAGLMADLLVATDLRGVFSHGTRQAPTYLGLIKRREVNPNPEVDIAAETPAIAVLNGDGGMGHFASWQAVHRLVEKAKAVGLGAVATRNHHHFGGAGKYSRVIAKAGLVGFVVSSHVRRFAPEQGIMAAGGASPMSFAIPAASGPPLVLDMATSFHPRRRENFAEVFEQMPDAFFKSLGLGAVCHSLGGLLAGIQTVEEDGHVWPAVNQGSFMIAVHFAPFASPER
ncbi:MAG: Ldh family oxidoreductase, partial [bacterium]|nr:Ldh family oxidoreductase [bacterium]